LWHYQKGRKTLEQHPAEIRINKIRKEAELLMDKQLKEVSWLESYKKLIKFRKE
jgi:hypothetical protein